MHRKQTNLVTFPETNFASSVASTNLVDERQAAVRLAVSVRTLQQWRVSGGGPRFAKIGRCVRYRASDLEAFVVANLRAHTSEEARS